MSTNEDIKHRFTKNRDMGIRLREERKRLGMSQEEFGQTGGVRRATQYLYEQGDRIPSMEYLSRVVAVGADLGYLVIGERSDGYGASRCIDKDTLAEVYRVVDEFARDKKGRLLDLEYRIALLNSLCDAVANKVPESIEWDVLRDKLQAEKASS